MQTIELQVKDEIFYGVGLQTIKERLQNELEFLYYEFLAQGIKQKIDDSGIDNDSELEKARELSWENAKKEFLKTTT